jgi:RNA polymerase sigma factor (sigma-70 family)
LEEPFAERFQRSDLVRKLLSLLTPLETAVLRAKYEGGLSFVQIARIIDRSPESVRQMHHRLLQALRELGIRQQE